MSETFIDNSGVSLCVERIGSGERHVLFLHGWISSRRMWYDVAARLDATRFSLHLLDFRGAGSSDRPGGGHHLEGYASDAMAAIESVDAPLTLVAHSMGGRIAQFIATQRPRHVQRMILVAPGLPAGPPANPRRVQSARDAYGNRKRIERFQRAAMALPVNAAVMQRLVDDALVAQREVWFGPAERPDPIDFTAALSNVEIPVLCIAGGKDPLAPASRVRSGVAGHIPGAVVVTLRDAGHNLPVEAPGDVAAAVERFM